jgi:hypothetical protein
MPDPGLSAPRLRLGGDRRVLLVALVLALGLSGCNGLGAGGMALYETTQG